MTETIVGRPSKELSGSNFDKVSAGWVAPITKHNGTACAKSSHKNSKSLKFEPTK